MQVNQPIYDPPQSYEDYLKLCSERDVLPALSPERFELFQSDQTGFPIEFSLQCSEDEFFELAAQSRHLCCLVDPDRYNNKSFSCDFSEIGLKIYFRIDQDFIESFEIQTDFFGNYLFEFYSNNRLIRTDSITGPSERKPLEADGVEWIAGPSEFDPLELEGLIIADDIFLHVTYLSENGKISTACLNFEDEVKGINPLVIDVKKFEY